MTTSAVEPSFRRINASPRRDHQQVLVADVVAGEVWREETLVVVSKLTEPRRSERKLRWFARDPQGKTLGRGTRAAMILGAGFKTKAEAVRALLVQDKA